MKNPIKKFLCIGLMLAMALGFKNSEVKATDVDETKNYISSIGELQGEKVKLVNVDNDPESQFVLANHYIKLDEEAFNFYFSGANLKSAEDILVCEKLNEKIETLKPFIIKNSENKPVGTVGIEYWEPYRGINISYIIAKEYWGNGYALDAVKALIKNFYENKIKASILIGSETENTRSLRVIEKLTKELGFENFNKDNKIKVFIAPKYSLEQKTMDFEVTYKIDEENPDIVLCSFSASGEKIGDYKFFKRLINPAILEKGYLEVKGQYVFITPIYQS